MQNTLALQRKTTHHSFAVRSEIWYRRLPNRSPFSLLRSYKGTSVTRDNCLLLLLLFDAVDILTNLRVVSRACHPRKPLSQVFLTCQSLTNHSSRLHRLLPYKWVANTNAYSGGSNTILEPRIPGVSFVRRSTSPFPLHGVFYATIFLFSLPKLFKQNLRVNYIILILCIKSCLERKQWELWSSVNSLVPLAKQWVRVTWLLLAYKQRLLGLGWDVSCSAKISKYTLRNYISRRNLKNVLQLQYKKNFQFLYIVLLISLQSRCISLFFALSSERKQAQGKCGARVMHDGLDVRLVLHTHLLTCLQNTKIQCLFCRLVTYVPMN